MPAKWLAEFIMLFRPEESPPFSDEKYPHLTTFRYVKKKSTVSVKAMVWTVIAIMAGLVIGQLH